MQPPVLRWILFGSGWLLAAGPLLAQIDDGPAEEAARAARMIAEESRRWSIQVAGDPDHAVVAGQDPTLRYTNPGVGRVHGGVYVFVRAGRPAAVMAVYKWFSPWTGFEAEIQSLATTPLEGRRDGQLIWQPDRPGMVMQDIPDAPRPAASAADRQAQIRTLAAGFSARLLDSRVNATGEGQALRLLPRPIFRSEGRETAPWDGGLFAFVLGTDPEVFLLLETHASPDGPRWQYGLARLNSDPLRVTFQGQEVWKATKVVDRYDARGTYFSKELPQTAATP